MHLRPKILALLAEPKYQPLDKVGLSRRLNIPPSERRKIRETLQSLEREGRIQRLSNGRFALPSAAAVISGVLTVFRNGNASCTDAANPARTFFIAEENLGTAMHGDRVQVRLLGKPGGNRREKRETGNQLPEARVVRVQESAHPTMVGALENDRGRLCFIPDDSRLPRPITLRSPETPLQPSPKEGDAVVIRLHPWEDRYSQPSGEIINVLGPARAPGVDMLTVIHKHHLPLEFPSDVLKEADSIPENLGASDLHQRRDLRGEPVLTIDPDDAKDYDDAIQVDRLADGGWALAVHIADVSHYVKRESALDREARKRGNSTYLADRVIPMLPERLSNGICSLKAGEDRLAFSVFLEFNANGQVRSANFSRSVIRSIARLTYRQAFAILQGTEYAPAHPDAPRAAAPADPRVPERVRAAWELAQILRRNRFASGSLDLDFPEVKVWLDTEGRAVRLEKIENDPSHQLIEECMLAANEAVAAAVKHRGTPTVYRIHEPPDPERLLEYRESVLACGFRIGDLNARREVQKLLATIKGRPEEHFLKLDFLKSLKRATYDVRPLGHYGLAKENYAHFTSPIRRYADLVLHRALAGAASGGAKELGETAVHISQTERTSAEAEKESVLRKKLEFFERQARTRQPQVFRAVVTDVRGHGLVVDLPEALMTGLVPVHTLPDDYYTFDPVKRSFRGKRTRQRFDLGTELRVVVCRVDAAKRQVDFAPAQE